MTTTRIQTVKPVTAKSTAVKPIFADQSDLVFDYVFCLYITGATYHSMLAVKNIKSICMKYLDGRYKLEIVDIYQQPQLAESQDIVAAPTLVRLRPLPLRKLIGDLSDTAKVLAALGIVDILDVQEEAS